MQEIIQEQIEVLANFNNQQVTPVCFRWRNRDYYVDNINFVHTSKDGETKLIHFAVSNETQNYKLTFNTTSLIWTLDELFTSAYKLKDSPNTLRVKDKLLASYQESLKHFFE